MVLKTTGKKNPVWVQVPSPSQNPWRLRILVSINSELDIYIPSLSLSFELNGIFHYEPIYGIDKLEKIKNNDNRKLQACIEKKIEFCILDISGSKHFKPERDKKYLDIVRNIILDKINGSVV